MDMQAAAFREAGPDDWESVFPHDPVPADQPILSPDEWDELRWDLQRQEPKTVAEGWRLATVRAADPSSPDAVGEANVYADIDDGSVVDVRARGMGALTAGGVWVGWLADAARSQGLTVVIVPGSSTRGHGGMRAVEGVVGHHTATSDAAKGDYPSLNIVTNGRAGLAGPLCNLGLGRNGTVYVVAAGCAWHAGVSAYAGFTDLNDEFLGIEAEDNGDGKWTPAMLDAYPRLVAGLLTYMRRGVDRYVSHRGCALPAGRKPDPAGIDDAWMRRQAAAHMTGAAPAPAPTPTPAPGHTIVPSEAMRMRYVNLDNPTGETPQRSAILTVDSVGDSLVMPKNARAWVQWAAFFPFGGEKAVAELSWLVFNYGGGRPPKAFPVRPLPHRATQAMELDPSVESVEIVVRNLPKGGAVGVHIDGIGHA